MKDDTRSLFWLIGWYCLTLIPFAGVGSVLAGIPGIILGLAASVTLGLWGYAAYIARH